MILGVWRGEIYSSSLFLFFFFLPPVLKPPVDVGCF